MLRADPASMAVLMRSRSLHLNTSSIIHAACVHGECIGIWRRRRAKQSVAGVRDGGTTGTYHFWLGAGRRVPYRSFLFNLRFSPLHHHTFDASKMTPPAQARYGAHTQAENIEETQNLLNDMQTSLIADMAGECHKGVGLGCH